jgi:glycosyltransferase involved in cell wall biosynthesis
MAKRAITSGRKEKETKPPAGTSSRAVATRELLPAAYWRACDLAAKGRFDEARSAYTRLARGLTRRSNPRLRVLIQNDQAALDAAQGNLSNARDQWLAIVQGDAECAIARLNLGLLAAELTWARTIAEPEKTENPPPSCPTSSDDGARADERPLDSETEPPHEAHRAAVPALPDSGPVRIAILSFLFNWPSTGGGNMHTAGLVDFLGRDGYEARHFYARFPGWGVGRVTDGGLVASEAIPFAESEWNVQVIRQRFRAAVDSFGPDFVVISDAWNMKPHLFEAMRGYPTILLQQAQECLCPLNNLRLLGIGPPKAEQCPRNQLATPQVCHQCLAERGQHSGALHQVERALAGVGTAEYDGLMRRAFQDAEAVLVLNPITAAMLEPFACRVHIVPWGIDPARFPWTADDDANGAEEASSVSARDGEKPIVRLFMAAVAGETIKGFHVAHEACRILRETRNDFELAVTFDPPGPIDEFTRAVGWCSQSELPSQYRSADICLVPTIAQDALSITSVEAMAAGRPVVASRIGGLPYTVSDGLTGLLFEPGNPWDLAEKITRLLDDAALRRQMGLAGRRRFEQDFMWPDVIKRYLRPLLGECVRG